MASPSVKVLRLLRMLLSFIVLALFLIGAAISDGCHPGVISRIGYSPSAPHLGRAIYDCRNSIDLACSRVGIERLGIIWPRDLVPDPGDGEISQGIVVYIHSCSFRRRGSETIRFSGRFLFSIRFLQGAFLRVVVEGCKGRPASRAVKSIRIYLPLA
ncbi:hypothetical protein BCR34DRAFT_584017 [Clohesyomyces aquaticus]|uniref:Cyanovirin-N domain-containing protein n=1 Tax=Clohesyomyces aquaticus TaxID=1231657 RepID=A0A1Y2A343_9PLEO|nr:hypothetical protein BCR34DRAFT_584017 [Clohesyomyces aquaticus]